MHFNIGFMLISFIAITLFQRWWIEQRSVETIPYSEPGQIAYETQRDTFLGNPASAVREYSPETAREIDCAIRAPVDEAPKTAMAILTRYQAQLNEGAKNLLEKETLLPDELPTLDLQLATQKALS